MSSGAFRTTNVTELLCEARNYGITGIELSSGMSFSDDMMISIERSYAKEDLSFLFHNYFPPPQNPFVLNIGALDISSLHLTKDMAKQGLELAKKYGAPFYSLHAGFAVKLSPDQLGKPKKLASELSSKDVDRETSYKVMLETVQELADYAAGLGVDLLIENNVISPLFLEKMPLNPLLLTEANEIKQFFTQVNRSNVGLLLDVAHAKVSANALGFDANNFVEIVADFVRCLHLSDNNGIEDTNQPFDLRSWFVPWLKEFSTCEMVVEVYQLDRATMLSQLGLLEKLLK